MPPWDLNLETASESALVIMEASSLAEVRFSFILSYIYSAGGFSDIFPRPSYQDQAVKNYLAKGKNVPPTSMFNAEGRCYPDITALGNAYNVIIGGQNYQLSGTSASAPVAAGMINLVNGLREAKGKSPLGFINPLLYSLESKSVLNDITDGDINCTAGQGSFLSLPAYHVLRLI